MRPPSPLVPQRWVTLLVFSLSALFAVQVANASLFSVEYFNPKSYQRADDLPLKVSPITSVHTQADANYYRLPFCRPIEGVVGGKQEENSAYEIQVLKEVRCKKLCQIRLTSDDAEKLSYYVHHGYHNNWKVDDMPAANVAVSRGVMQKHYAGGFPIGFIDTNENDAYVFNHVKLYIDYHVREDGYRIVGFGVEPTSVKHGFPPGFEWDGISTEGFLKELKTCPSDLNSEFINQDYVETVQIVKPGEPILYTYDVTWQESDVASDSRWVVYLTEDYFVPPQVHIYSIVNSTLVVLFLSVVVSCILVKNLKRDVAASRGRSQGSHDDDDDRKGWKSLHGDVFRPPQTMPFLFCAMVGTGIQLAITGLLVLVLATLNIVSPVKRGSFVMAAWTAYTVLGCPVGGYVSGRLYRNFGGGKDCKEQAWLTTTIFPGMVFAVSAVFSLFSPAFTKPSIPSVLVTVGVSCLIGYVLTKHGMEKGYNAAAPNLEDFPTTTSSLARDIPPPSCRHGCFLDVLYLVFTGVSPYCAAWKVPIVAVLWVGVVPFAAVYVELFFIMTNLFMQQYYWTFGFALIVYTIVMIISAQVTVLFVYHRLNGENHIWWWPAFFCAGSIGFYIFAYSIVWVSTLEIHEDTYFTAHMLYFGKMLLISCGAFLLCGSVGTLAALGFVCKLFSTVRPQGEGDYVELLNNDDDDATAGVLDGNDNNNNNGQP
ncbi:Transmembrane 9 superfamily [Seminavis robusta]|uniref:Transmembrane 9 superfamily member n=1 Tax=Seminavis robusta TaxID=568900 RepID=A0A9N8H616_9STRA|nr:Transmembrane 9 superfamily [Seminavis robusta]|eukprot:Sro87_g046250.1 Transmembrane 9 superfamily (708) ;mRNA; f:109620-111833